MRGRRLGGSVMWMLALGCGRVADSTDAMPGAGGTSAGSSASAGRDSIGGTSSAGTSGGGSSNAGSDRGGNAPAFGGAAGYGGNTAGSAGTAIEPDPVLDGYSRARWPIPNAPG